MYTTDWYLIELLLLNSNAWKHLTVWKQIINKIELFVLDRNTCNHLTVYKKMSLGSFQNVIFKMCSETIYLINMTKENLAFNNQQ